MFLSPILSEAPFVFALLGKKEYLSIFRPGASPQGEHVVSVCL